MRNKKGTSAAGQLDFDGMQGISNVQGSAFAYQGPKNELTYNNVDLLGMEATGVWQETETPEQKKERQEMEKESATLDWSLNQDLGTGEIAALESAVALPGVYRPPELRRFLTRNQHDVMRTAVLLKEKHHWQKENGCFKLSVKDVHLELSKDYIRILPNRDRDGCPVILFTRRNFKPHSKAGMKTATQDGAVDRSSDFGEAIKTITYILNHAANCMEQTRAEGIVAIMDLEGSQAANFSVKIDNSLMKILRAQFPEIMKRMYIVNSNVYTKGLAKAIAQAIPEKTRKKVTVLTDIKNPKSIQEICNLIPRHHLPREFGGESQLADIQDFIKELCLYEGVHLGNEEAVEKEANFSTSAALDLNGMQYAGCSATEVSAMASTGLRGQLWRKKKDTNAGVPKKSLNVFGFGWKKFYAVLRPDALLLYEDQKGNRPELIIPMKDSQVKVSNFENQPRGSAGFLIQTPMQMHLIASTKEADRMRWVQSIQVGIDACHARINNEVRAAEDEIKRVEEFDALEMIDFGPDSPKRGGNCNLLVQTEEQVVPLQVVEQGQQQHHMQSQTAQPDQIPSTMTQQQHMGQPHGSPQMMGMQGAPNLMHQGGMSNMQMQMQPGMPNMHMQMQPAGMQMQHPNMQMPQVELNMQQQYSMEALPSHDMEQHVHQEIQDASALDAKPPNIGVPTSFVQAELHATSGTSSDLPPTRTLHSDSSAVTGFDFLGDNNTNTKHPSDGTQYPELVHASNNGTLGEAGIVANSNTASAISAMSHSSPSMEDQATPGGLQAQLFKAQEDLKLLQLKMQSQTAQSDQIPSTMAQQQHMGQPHGSPQMMGMQGAPNLMHQGGMSNMQMQMQPGMPNMHMQMQPAGMQMQHPNMQMPQQTGQRQGMQIGDQQMSQMQYQPQMQMQGMYQQPMYHQQGMMYNQQMVYQQPQMGMNARMGMQMQPPQTGDQQQMHQFYQMQHQQTQQQRK